MSAARKKSAPERDLRLRAEARLKASDSALAPLPFAVDRRLHELQVHQIELELQNEELRSTRAQVEAGLAKFTDLYDFSPVGYFTLGRGGVIAQTNLAGARLLGRERARLTGKRFSLFVIEPDRIGFDAFLRLVFAAAPAPACEVGVDGPANIARIVRIEAVLSTDGQECRAVVMDVTESRLAEAENRRLNAELEERVRLRTATIRKLATEMTLVEQRERIRVSHVLHEDLQQIIIGAKFLAQAVKGASAEDGKRLRQVDGILSNGADVTRMLAVELSPPILRGEDFGTVLRWLGRWMGENHSLAVEVTVSAGMRPLPEVLSVNLYQAVRELLLNVVKHAKVGAATVEMDCHNGRVRVVVGDKGWGFVAAGLRAPGESSDTFGLFSVRERLALLGGEMAIESEPGKGSRITLDVPFSRVAD